MPTTMAQWFRRGPAYDPDPALAECVLDDDFFSFLYATIVSIKIRWTFFWENRNAESAYGITHFPT